METRLLALEQRFEALKAQVLDILAQVKAAAQAARNAYQQYQPSGANTGAAYFCLPTTIGGATGSWPSLTPSSQSLTVYQVNGSSISSFGTYTVYNWYPSAPAASKVCQVAPDGYGNFVVVAQSCS